MERALVSQFEKQFGCPAVYAAWAPGRINLIGEHTDYNEGFVLPSSLHLGTLCAFRQNGLSRHRLWAADLKQGIELSAGHLEAQPLQWANYVIGIMQGIQDLGLHLPTLDLAFSCDVPTGAGLSSSASICSSVARGLNDAFGLGLDNWTLVRLCQNAENSYVGAKTGILDPFASLFGQEGKALLLDCRSLEYQVCAMEIPGHELILLNTGIKHNHLLSGYADRRADCERAIQQLRQAGWKGESLRDLDLPSLGSLSGHLDGKAEMRAQFIVAENQRVINAVAQLACGDAVGFGESLFESHWGLSRLYEVSCPESDAVVSFAERQPAAKGARQMGGGFGGCILCLVESKAVDDFVDEAQQDYFDRFGLTLELIEIAPGPGAYSFKP